MVPFIVGLNDVQSGVLILPLISHDFKIFRNETTETNVFRSVRGIGAFRLFLHFVTGTKHYGRGCNHRSGLRSESPRSQRHDPEIRASRKSKLLIRESSFWTYQNASRHL